MTYCRWASIRIGPCTVWAKEDEVFPIHGDVPWDTAPHRVHVRRTQSDPAPCTEQQEITKVIAEGTPLFDVSNSL
jgi:hypothetical protein